MYQAQSGVDAQRVVSIARALRMLLCWFGVRMLVAITVGVTVASAAQSSDTVGALPRVLSLVSWVLLLVVLYWTYRLAQALDKPGVVWVLLMFVPLVNLICLLVLNDNACKAMRAAGLSVGLLGPNKAELDRYERTHRAERPAEPGL
ncbi:MAG: hypothetical protein HZB16_03370 [Armatimonadetes bacterium]|nr:hypothetical protein [Armatimonadota bacterium]